MATVSSLNVRMGADIKELQSKMKQVGKSVQELGNRMTSVGKTISTRLTAPIVAFGTASVMAFAKQEKAELQLRAALMANGRAVDSLFSKYSAFATEMQRLTVIGDETTLAMLAQAESLGLTGNAAERAVRNSIAMQSAFGVNAQSALRYTAALEQGNATMLTRYIPTLRDIEDESERAAEAQRVLSRAFSAAESEAQSLGGSFTQVTNKLGDAFEDIGESIAEAFNLSEVASNLVDKIGQFQKWFAGLSTDVKKKMVIVTAAIAGVGPALTAVGLAISAFGIAISALASPITLTIGALAALGAAVLYLRDNWQAVTERISDITWWRNAIIDMIQFFIDHNPFSYLIKGFNHVLEYFDREPIGDIFNTMSEDLEGLKGETKEYETEFKSLGETVKSVLAEFTGISLDDFTVDVSGGGGVQKITSSINQAKASVQGFSSVFSAEMGKVNEVSLRTAETVETNSQRWPEAIRNAMQRTQEVTAQIAEVIRSGVINMAEDFAFAIGRMAVTGEGLGGVFKSLLSNIADMAIQIGKIILFSGKAIEALKASLVTFFGGSAVAAGLALIGIGAAAKGALSAIGGGGSGGGGSIGSSNAGFQRTVRSEPQSGRVEFVLKGDRLVGVLQNVSKNSGRVGKTVQLQI